MWSGSEMLPMLTPEVSRSQPDNKESERSNYLINYHSWSADATKKDSKEYAEWISFCLSNPITK